jgi:hypothetical protein
VPSELATYTESTALACCRRCLSVTPGDPDDPSSEPPFQSIIRRFPTGTEGVAFLVLLDKFDSLALNRSDIESLVDYLETNGVDLFLTLNRLLAEPEIEPYLDLSRRRDQLEQLLD